MTATALTAPLPLRTTAAWGAYASVAVIPHRYGRVSGAALPLDSTRTRFVWADHASAGIDAVTVGGADAADWQWRNDVDPTGHPVTLIVFNQAVDAGADVAASGRGKQHPVTGVLLENPAAVLWDVLANVAGRPLAESALAAFAAECRAAQLLAAGSLDAADPVGSVARAIAESVGALYAADLPGLARLWPASATRARVRVDQRLVVEATCSAEALCNDLTLNFDFADGEARQSIHLDAPDSIARRGRLAASVEARWIADARVAFSVAAQRLATTARPRWVVSVGGLRQPLALGDAVELSHPVVPLSGLHTVTARERPLDGSASRATVVAMPSGTVAVRLVGQGAAFAPRAYSNVVVQTVGSDRVLTLQEADGRPIAGASVTLDGSIARTTDDGGRVSFPAALMPVGWHTLVILTADGRTLTQTVLVQ